MPKASAVTIALAWLTAAIGAFFMFQSLFLIRPATTPPAPGDEWLGVGIGAVFFCGGLSAALTPFDGRIGRAIRSALGLVVGVGLTLLLGWVAFGPGHHEISSPLVIFGPKVAEATGRAAFAVGALIGALIVVLGLRSFWRQLFGGGPDPVG